MIKRFKFMMCLFFIVGLSAYGKNDVRFELIVPEKVYSDREFTIAFRLEDADGQDFRAPKFKGCRVIEGPRVSRSSQFLMDRGRGRSINYTDFVYVLKADRKKKVRIGSATVRVDGKLQRSAPRDISVENIQKRDYSNESVTFSAIVPEKVEAGEDFKVVFVLKNAQGENFNLPVVKNCEFLHGPDITRSGGAFFWGRSPIETSYTIVLKAKRAGTVTLPSATIVVNGKIMKSKRVKIRVFPQSEKTRTRKFNEAQRKYQSI